MIRNLAVLVTLFAALGLISCIQAPPPQSAEQLNLGGDPFHAFTRVGDHVPSFAVTTLDGKAFSTQELKGKVLVINLWATWCGPCRQEMPRLEREVWNVFKSQNFAMVAIAREETESLITGFRESNGFTFPMAADPEREIYKHFADAGIPRTYIIGRDGTILHQSLGYEPDEFESLVKTLREELGKPLAN